MPTTQRNVLDLGQRELSQQEERDLGTVTGGVGGYLAPQAFFDRVVKAQKLLSGVRKAAFVFQTDTGSPMPIPMDNDTANVGERLPYVPYFSWSSNLRYEHPLPVAHGLRGYAQIDLSHKGDMWNDLHVVGSKGFPRILQPGYTIMNLRVGLNPEGGHWLGEFYITNLADKNAIIFSNTGNYDLRQTTNEPRVYGLRLNYRFGKETNSE